MVGRRKADAERIRKEEEKARRELIKQEYLRRKQQEMFEEQGQAKPKPKPKKQRPKSVFHEESITDGYPKCSPASKPSLSTSVALFLFLALCLSAWETISVPHCLLALPNGHVASETKARVNYL